MGLDTRFTNCPHCGAKFEDSGEPSPTIREEENELPLPGSVSYGRCGVPGGYKEDGLIMFDD